MRPSNFDPDGEEEPIVLEPGGEADFAAVGTAFSEWVASTQTLPSPQPIHHY